MKKLVKVYQAKDEIDASLIIGFLESNDIKAEAFESASNSPPVFSGDARSSVMHLVPRDILVAQEQAAEAIELIKDVRN